MSRPTVALVGRPNTGKSTLFNRIVGGRRAIVSDRPGTTRDRHFGEAEWNGRAFWLVDTGGLVPDSSDSMDRAIARQVELALEQADVVVYDPEASAEGVLAAESAVEAVRGADVLVVATEWPEFREVDLAQVRKLMRGHRIVDARNLLDPHKVRAAGFDYVGMGRPLA